ncbi:MAG: hypothetical protein ACLR5S_02300 [Ruminococcus sp.]
MGMLPIKLTLERTRMTTLWINGRLVGSCDSLCTPHVYDITDFVTKPLVEILVLVENTGYPTKGGHLTSPDTQSNWNGITGQMTLEVFPEVYVDHVQATRPGKKCHPYHAAPRGITASFPPLAALGGQRRGHHSAVPGAADGGRKRHGFVTIPWTRRMRGANTTRPVLSVLHHR